MSLTGATVFVGIATSVLAVLAGVTARYARNAFREQSKEVRDQAKMLEVQSHQLEVYRKQVDDQHQINVTHGEVLELQVKEIRASLEQRARDAEEQRRRQASQVAAWFTSKWFEPGSFNVWGANIRNSSDLPILDVRVAFHYIQEKPGGEWEPVLRGSPVEKIRVIPPQSDRFYEIPEPVRNMINEVSDSLYVVSIEFTDAAGNHWERDPRGALIPRG
jgi:hypothetical protein